MIFWNFKTSLTLIGCCVWNFCEYFKLSLGKIAPAVFEIAIGVRGKKLSR